MYGPTSEGQFAQYWELPAGAIEIRWPADPREIYDVEQPRIRGDRSTFDAMTVGVPDDGTQAAVKVPSIDPGLTVDGATLTMSATPISATLKAPCDVLQVRYIDHDGNQTTRGYNIADFKRDPMFGADLNPLVTSTADASSAPDPSAVANCGVNYIDTDMAGPRAETAADALLAFVGSNQLPGLMASGYSEFKSTAETVYAIVNDGTPITRITVTHTGSNWAVSHVTSAGG